jgi:hypothetical protein
VAASTQFDGKNYDVWCINMKTIFFSQELWELIENGFPEPTDQVSFNALTQDERNTLKRRTRRRMPRLFTLYRQLWETPFFQG